MDRDPYQAPQSVVEDATDRVGAPLFRINAIGLATVLGSVLAGGWLIAMNYAALGRPAQALKAKVLSVLSLFALMALSMVLPEQVPRVAVIVPQVFGLIYLARSLQGKAIAERIAAGRPMRSNWLAAGIALLFLVIVLALNVALVVGGIYLSGSGVDGGGL
ncbi:hypothetical protein [Lysobacter sp. Root690]|uniref:hypothetical protein n=1 Tax=Lysobacter sp. Root690 TaxID=1736588 RepID=UPI0006F9A140|nr:hypothetical protein [Lysobacter sp. Root690]KRB11479.1 hypothetical protein ASD86_03470 [Lysobacter sp. Root690]